MNSFSLFLSVLFLATAIGNLRAKYLLVDIEEEEKVPEIKEPIVSVPEIKEPLVSVPEIKEPLVSVPEIKEIVDGEKSNPIDHQKNLDKISEDVVEKAAVTKGPLIVETIEPVAFVTDEPSIIELAKNISSIDGGSGKKGVVVPPIKVDPVPQIKVDPITTVRACCKDRNIPDYCLGLCTPAGMISSRSDRVNACTQYKTAVAVCIVNYWKPDIKSKASCIPSCESGYVCCDHECKSSC